MKTAVLVALLCLTATLSTTPYCAGALMAQARGQEPVMPPEGNPGHNEPPKGAWCDRSANAAHHCECHNKCVESEDGTVTAQEDGPHCRAYCYKKYCRCPWDECKTPSPQARQ